MITSPSFSGKRFAILGLARSGLATVEALVASGAEVTAWDAREEAREQVLRSHPGESRDPLSPDSEFMGPGFRRGDSVAIADPMEIDLADYDAVVVSPGVPLNTHPIAARARAAGVPLIGDIELFAQAQETLPTHLVVAVTGTNGKSTTTALIHHIAETAGFTAMMGGNIGLPILAQEPLPDCGLYVLELSSYQIDLTSSLDCNVAVLLNITPDHLDRYENFDAYAASKARLFDMQWPDQDAVIGMGDEASRKIADKLLAARRPELVHLIERVTLADQANWPALQGPHNARNAAAAIAAARALYFNEEAIAEGLRTYPGLPHRMERVTERGGILFVNDSKATNTESTAPALAAYPSVHWIVGGRAKSEDLGPCADQLDHVRAAYTIGEAGPMFARLLKDRVPVRQSDVLEKAVMDAAEAAVAGEVVLLSPACASFDQYRDYEARGQAFRDAVGALA